MLFELDTRDRPHTIEVEYEYCRGYSGNYYEPPEPEHCELVSVKLHGHEVIDCLTDSEIEKIMEACLDKVHDDIADAIMSAMDY